MSGIGTTTHLDFNTVLYGIFGLFARMRQLCCHPGLIKGMLDPESVSHEVIEDGGEDIDLISRLEVMNLEKDESGTYNQCCGSGSRSGRTKNF
jgi:hypothetical protein